MKSKNFINKMPLPDDPGYAEESYEIDTEDINGSASMTDDFKPGPGINLANEDLKAIDHPT